MHQTLTSEMPDPRLTGQEVSRKKNVFGLALLASTGVMLSACYTMGGLAQRGSRRGAPGGCAGHQALCRHIQGKINSTARKLAAEGLNAIDAKDYKKRLRSFSIWR